MGNTVQMVRPNLERPPEEEESIEDDESSTFACEICIEPMLSSSTNKFRNNNRCVHPFCTDCIMKYIQVKVDENVADVPCPSLNCEQLLDPLSSRPIVPTKLFEKWCDVLCESTVLGFDRSYCPNQNCSALILNECGGNVKRSKCPNCKRLFCFRCKIPWHSGYRCEESGEMRHRNDVEFGLLVERNNWKRCPRCGHCIERFTGCRAIKCRCGTSFCYKCGSEFKDLRCRCGVSYHLCCFWFIRFIVLVVFIIATVFAMRKIIKGPHP